MILYICRGLRPKTLEGRLKFNIAKDQNFSFKKNTTYGLGGYCKHVDKPQNTLELIVSYLRCREDNYFILGNGSNVLAQDGEWKGTIISTKKVNRICRIARNKLFISCGVQVAQLLQYCKKEGLSGAEFLAGIPATMGGIVYMNGGASGYYVNTIVDSVLLFDQKIAKIDNKNCNFSYKHSTMQDINAIILGVIVKLDAILPQIVEERINYFLNKRNHLPIGKSCGCVFKNPSNYTAGYLIEQAGLKTFERKGCYVSDVHANFILYRLTSSQFMFEMIQIIKQIVQEKTGICLIEEVRYLGEFNYDFNG